MQKELNLVELLAITAPTMSDAFKGAISSSETSHQEKLMLALLSQCGEHLETLGLALGIWFSPIGAQIVFSAFHNNDA
ncbi:hypothetical protein IYR97_08005 [Pseudomonas fulva]|uniref:Uncharacterized protein n=1 Tax=Pseudomonas fulva TaxID=47880 RepID=A0A7S9Q504_9PSED|nr:hypothetical protein [Pseudomonas fulva]QPH45547.1 hypothetical protein IYR97_08005 [Pseudomonas fulva]QPH50632.1 hypothetical protein IZU98_08020 [Pseudomonas fulva]